MIKTDGEGVNVLVRCYADVVKWLGDCWTRAPGYFQKIRRRLMVSNEKKQKGVKNVKNLWS